MGAIGGRARSGGESEASWRQDWRALQKKAKAADAEARAGVARVADRLDLRVPDRAFDAHKDGLCELRDRLEALSEAKQPLRHCQSSQAEVRDLAQCFDRAESLIAELKHSLPETLCRLDEQERELDRAINATHNSLHFSSTSHKHQQENSRSHPSEKANAVSNKRAAPAHGTAAKMACESAIKELERFLRANGGSENGTWDERDHRQFKRALASVNCDYSRLPDLIVHGQWPPLAHLSRQDVIEHCRFDQELERLKGLRRAELDVWRMRKQEEQAQKQQQFAAECARAEREQQEQEQRKQERLARERKQRFEVARRRREHMQLSRSRATPREEEESKVGKQAQQRKRVSLEELQRRAEERRQRMRARTLRTADERVEEAMMTSNTNGLARGEEEAGRDRRASSPSLSSSSGGRRSSSRRAIRESAAEAVATGKMWAE